MAHRFSSGELAAGSTVTPSRRLARAFSHKPAIVSLGDDGTVHHNGAEPGILTRWTRR